MTSRLRKVIAPVVAVTALCLCTSACSQGENSDWKSLFDIVKRTWEQSGNQSVTLEDAANVPYASIGIRVGDQGERMLVLAVDNGGDQIWTSSSRIVLSTHGGRIIRAIGFGNDLTGFTAERGDVFPNSTAAWTTPRHVAWLADFAQEGLYSVEISCYDVPVGPDKIQILGHDIQTTRVDETCDAPQIGWHFVNRFWIDPDNGAVWQSVQYVNPRVAPINVEVLRPT